MLRNVNKDYRIECPPATIAWMSNNWPQVSVGNIQLYLEHNNTYSLSWSRDSVKAAEVMDHLLSVSNNRRIVEGCLRDRRNTGAIEVFLKNRLPELLKKKENSWVELDANSAVSAVTRSLSTLQIQEVWDLIKGTNVVVTFAAQVVPSKVPDVILKQIIYHILKDVEPNVGYIAGCIAEAYRRKILITTLPEKETVPMIVPAVEKKLEQTEVAALVSMVPGKVYKI